MNPSMLMGIICIMAVSLLLLAVGNNAKTVIFGDKIGAFAAAVCAVAAGGTSMTCHKNGR